jgi:NAD(P)-dependent dehydrogenase (short-subunit alcohol dehydrogenase family)
MTVIGVATSPPATDLAADPGLHFVLGDVAHEATWTRVAEVIARLGAAPDVLVLNAARALHGTVLDLTLDDWRMSFETNVFGAVLGARACLPGMIERGNGAIVIVSSVNGWMAEQGLIAYSCTKATLIEMAKSLAVDHAHQGIRVNVVAPGTTDTPAFRRGMDSSCDGAGWTAARARRNPLGRILAAEEVANTVWFLATNESSGMTGSVLTVDAGLTASFDYRSPEDPTYR